jgi:hypothetical protein
LLIRNYGFSLFTLRRSKSSPPTRKRVFPRAFVFIELESAIRIDGKNERGQNILYYGENLDVLRLHVKDETICPRALQSLPEVQLCMGIPAAF